MTPDFKKRVEKIAAQALQIDDLAERDEYVQQACGGDATTLAAVQARIALGSASTLPHDESLKQTPANPASPPLFAPQDPLIGELFGNYEIVGKIDEGGMGAVYQVRHTGDIGQIAALKSISSGEKNSKSLGRFRTERRALLRTNPHENIIRLFDPGFGTGEVPYFIMEVVNGLPIDAYCKKRFGLPPGRKKIKALVGLFRTVCRAVQHAHQNDVVHCDLKPSNVQVTEDEVPKLIDFGIARIKKREEQDPFDLGSKIVSCTLPYASPEHVVLGPADPSTDVYSLGVVLYELLTGRLPYFVSREDIPRSILNIKQKKPAPLRSDKASKRSIDRPLEQIVLKALEKDQHQRYQSAGAFADDLDCYLRREPVKAAKGWTRPFYCGRLFFQRHVGLAATAAVVGLVLLISLIVCWNGWSAAATARDNITAAEAEKARLLQAALAAKQLADKNLKQAETNLQTANAERRRADGYFQDASRLIQSLGDVATNLVAVPGAESIREAMDSKLLEYSQRFLDQSKDDKDNPRRQAERALAFVRQGIARQTRGALDEALKSLQSALEIQERLDPKNDGYQQDLAQSLNIEGVILGHLGRDEEALEAFERSGNIYEKLRKNHPDDPQARRQVAMNYSNRGLSMFERGNEQGLALTVEAYRLQHELARLDGILATQPDLLAELTTTCGNLGIIFSRRGKIPEAQAYYEEGRERARELVTRYPSNAKYQNELATVLFNLATFHDIYTHNHKESLAALDEAETIADRLNKEYPAAVEYWDLRIRIDMLYAQVFEDAQRWKEADGALLQAQKLSESKLVALHPDVPDFRFQLAKILQRLGQIRVMANRPTDAVIPLAESRRILAGLLSRFPKSLDYLRVLAKVSIDEGNSHFNQQQYKEASKCFEEGLAEAKQLLELGANEDYDHTNLAKGQRLVGTAHVQEGQYEEALQDSEKARQLLKESRMKFGDRAELRKEEAMADYDTAVALTHQNKPAEALKAFDDGLSLQATVLKEAPDNIEYLNVAKYLCFDKAKLQADQLGQFDEAAKTLEEGKRLWPHRGDLLVLTATKLAALSAAAKGDDRSRIAKQALDTLEEAVAAGFDKLDRLETEGDYQPLRDLPDFSKRIKSLKTSASSEKK